MLARPSLAHSNNTEKEINNPALTQPPANSIHDVATPTRSRHLPTERIRPWTVRLLRDASTRGWWDGGYQWMEA